jgi:hypothetical protein
MERSISSCNNRCFLKNNRRDDIPFFIDKDKSENNGYNKHIENIVDVLKDWRDRNFDIGDNFYLFHVEYLKIDLIEQLVPNTSNTTNGLQTKFEQTISHLNCEDYQYIYQKYNKIKELQNNFNSQITQFVEDNKNHLREFLKAHNINPTEKELDNYLQFYLYWIDYKKKII